ncbi:hypothetical protein BU24DRAFT_416108 [Aaosphaeria arxii CBS 175.79]|uniref:Uncharacterized protein n=1 Tax=Aaosphaeria arxii CBS 175.79 TaxID=1450172 RepID=A0A6A5Y556_9PLEO|nr:uncharacterized protein BU24DRAFT_416108 [Aaosphaeria arxii CBS 175.79]KAF2020409.1 hypothetical protein BU24DRAFT_416108 [Aaosphaeria arxii CBS 175.79]
MPPPSDASSSGEVRVGVFYDLSRKELLLRFDSSAYARAYQRKNPEARILADNRKEVWLPLCDSMRTLRSSDTCGMVIIFRSKEDRRLWLDRSVLGTDINTSDGEYGVRFKRSWSRNEIERALDYAGASRDSLGVPQDKHNPHSRPGSRNGQNTPRHPQYRPVESPPSNPPPHFEPVQSPGSKPAYFPVDSRPSAHNI